MKAGQTRKRGKGTEENRGGVVAWRGVKCRTVQNVVGIRAISLGWHIHLTILKIMSLK